HPYVMHLELGLGHFPCSVSNTALRNIDSRDQHAGLPKDRRMAPTAAPHVQHPLPTSQPALLDQGQYEPSGIHRIPMAVQDLVPCGTEPSVKPTHHLPIGRNVLALAGRSIIFRGSLAKSVV